MGYGIIHLMSTTTPKKSKRGGKGCGKAGPQTVLSGSNMGVFKVDGPPTKRRAGRPCEYSVERTDYICAELAKGRSLHSILQEPGQPDRTTIVDWLVKFPEFSAKYAHSKEVGYDAFAEKMLARATDVPPELANSRRLEVDTGRWLLGKLCRRYNDKVDIRQEVSGPGGQPLALQADVLINALFAPARLAQLSESEIQSLSQVFGKLTAPTTDASKTVDGECTAVPEVEE
jgi:hypothetical protein